MGNQIPAYEKMGNVLFKEGVPSLVELKKKYVLGRCDLSAQELQELYPPSFQCYNKKLLYAEMLKRNKVWKGQVEFSRWEEMPLPQKLDPKSEIEVEEHKDAFEYVQRDSIKNQQMQNNPHAEYYFNFADRHLFGYATGQLFANDEMQAMEMPILVSLRDHVETLSRKKHKETQASKEDDMGIEPLTRLNDGRSSPCIIRNVERRLRVDTARNPSIGAPFGLYGNNFAPADIRTIMAATTFYDKPVLTNIVAIEAPKNQKGVYTRNTILYMAKALYTGFMGCIAEGIENDASTNVVIHGGNWGAGAYGGNLVLCHLLQVFCLHLSATSVAKEHKGALKLHLHTFDNPGHRAFGEAMKLYDVWMKKTNDFSTEAFIDFLEKQQFKWGVSNGT